MITSSQLLAYVNGDERPEFGDAQTNDFADTCVAEAEALVASLSGVENAPAVLVDRATLEVAANLYSRKGTSNEGSTASLFGGVVGPARSSGNPTAAAIKLLRKWVLPF